jgi:hypothetical protein
MKGLRLRSGQGTAAFLGIVAVAVAIWLLPASIHIVEWTADGPHRLALFASRTRLVALIASAVAGGGVLLTVGARRGAFAWLCLLWLWALPFLPWLPDRFPLLLILAGPIRWIVAAIAIAGVSRQLVRTPASQDRIWPLTILDLTTVRMAVFGVSLALYLILGSLHARAIGPGGDEPHYLVIAHSLLADGDLQIENNHARRDYQAFWAGPTLRPDYMKRGLNGQIYSIHAPGLAFLVLPVYAAAGYGGVVAFLCLLAALAALAVFDLSYEIAGARAAVITYAAVALTVPFLPHGWLIYPEVPAALIVAWALRWVWQGEVRLKADTTPVRLQADIPILRLVVRGTLLALLPWLHTKFVIFLAVFGGVLLFQLRRRPRAAAALAAPMALSIGAWLAFFYVIYGSFNPEAPYGDYPRLFVLMRNIPRGLLGLLFDQKFGLLVYAPIYLFSAAGAWLMLRQREWRLLGAVVLAAVAIHVGSTTRLYMWWGGNSAPARFLVPILPCLAAPIAVAVARWRSPAARALLWTVLTVSVVVAIGGLVDPERLLLFSDPRGKGRIVELLQGPAPLAALLPTFAQEDWLTPLIALLPWLGAVGVSAAAVLALQRKRGTVRTPLAVGVAGGLVFMAAASVLAVRVPAEEEQAAARQGAVDVMWQYDPQRLRALDYATLSRVDQRGVFDRSRITVNVDSGGADSTQRMMVGPLNLPAGSYQARIWFTEGLAHDGEVVVSSSDRAVFARVGNSVQNPLVVPFELPFGVRRLTISASGAARSAARAELEPKAIVPPDRREPTTPRTIEAIPEHPGAYLGYMNEHAYPEGGVFWTRGTGKADVLVAPAGARRLIVTLFSGPSGADCAVILSGAQQIVKTTPGEASTVSFAIPAGQLSMPLAVSASTYFRPSDSDPASTDTRGLGCQVRVGLE